MKIVVNGEEVSSKDNLTVNELLVEQKVKMPDMVSVELNGQILRRNEFEATTVKEGDKVEFLYFMGGGSGTGFPFCNTSQNGVPLTEQQIERYSRQIILEEVGGTGQEKLLSSRVLIVGAGGLGAPAALYLAAAGIGTIGIIDDDKVDLTNLQRQIIHTTGDLGAEKVDSARAKMQAINPDVTVRTHHARATAENMSEIVRQYDFVIDGTDNFAAKFLINDACYFEKIPFSHAGILRFDGQLITVLPGETTCYRCIFRSPPPAGAVPSCSQAGVLGVLAGVIGSLQATEAMKYLLGIGDLLTNTLLIYNALTMEFRKVKLNRNPNCLLCGHNPQVTELREEEQPVCDLKEG
jgi:thiamine biosynthesis protein ThiS